MAAPTRIYPAAAITDFLVSGTLSPEGIECLEALLRDHEREILHLTDGPEWGRADIREKYGVKPRASALLVREKAGYGHAVSCAWYAAQALDAVTGSGHCERLLAEYGRELLGLDSPIEEPEEAEEA